MSNKQNFRVFNDIAKKYTLKGCSLDVFSLILSFTRDNKQCSYSQETLSSLLGYNRSSINIAIHDLKSKGLIQETESVYESKSWIATNKLVAFSKNCKNHFYNRSIERIKYFNKEKINHSRQIVFDIIQAYEDADLICTRKAIKQNYVYSNQTLCDSISDLLKLGLIQEKKHKGKCRSYIISKNILSPAESRRRSDLTSNSTPTSSESKNVAFESLEECLKKCME